MDGKEEAAMRTKRANTHTKHATNTSDDLGRCRWSDINKKREVRDKEREKIKKKIAKKATKAKDECRRKKYDEHEPKRWRKMQCISVQLMFSAANAKN